MRRGVGVGVDGVASFRDDLICSKVCYCTTALLFFSESLSYIRTNDEIQNNHVRFMALITITCSSDFHLVGFQAGLVHMELHWVLPAGGAFC